MSTAKLITRVAAAAIACLAAGGCDSTQKAPTGSSLQETKMASLPELSGAVADYQEGRYRQAFEASRELARTTTGPKHEQAAWVAGLCAYQLNDLDEAERQFMACERSSDPRVAGDAKVMLGDIRVKQNRMREAADYYRAAAGLLINEERTRALQLADVAAAQAQSGSSSAAAMNGAAPSSKGATTPAASPPASTTPSGPGGSFTLQAGAFGSETNARKKANEVAATVRAAGLGEPRVTRTHDAKGRELWAVQVGTFASKQRAEDARAKLGSLELVVEKTG